MYGRRLDSVLLGKPEGEIPLNKSIRVAFCGILTALCTVLMFLTGLISIGTYALPALSGMLLVAVVIELGTAWAWPVYIAVSILSLILAADKEAAALYILFFGYYPIIKALLEKTRKKYLILVLKFVLFNCSMIACYFLSIKVLGVPEESFTFRGIYLPWIFLLVGNIAFILYDYAISAIVVTYYQKFHPTISRLFRMK
jgi:hypothetical protein